MPRRARVKCESGYYHVVNRGVAHQTLFEEEEDYERFLDTLSRYQSKEDFEIIAYCLMDNHIHLLLHAEDNLAGIMKKICCSYAYFFNNKYERSGHLFQDRYSSEAIDSDRYLLAVVRYIHNNPQKAGICLRNEYPWSSWREYSEKSKLVATDLVLGITGGLDGFLQLSESNEEVECLDISDSRKLSDKQALGIIKSKLKIDSGMEMQKLPREQRDWMLRFLKNEGLSVRQLERLTGINRGVVLKA